MIPSVNDIVIINNKTYKVEELYKDSLLVSYGDKFQAFYYSEIQEIKRTTNNV